MQGALKLVHPKPEPPVFRELQPDEYQLLKNLPPYDRYGIPDPRGARVLVAQTQGGEIVACATAFNCVHVEPVWIHPDYRKRPGFIRTLWNGVEKLLRSAGQQVVFAVINWADIPNGNLSMASRLGFMRIPGDLYFLRVPEKPRWEGPDLGPDVGP